MWNTCTSYLDVSGLAYSASQSLDTEAVPLEEAYPAPLLRVEEHPRLQPISKSMSEDHVAVDIEVFGGTWYGRSIGRQQTYRPPLDLRMKSQVRRDALKLPDLLSPYTAYA